MSTGSPVYVYGVVGDGAQIPSDTSGVNGEPVRLVVDAPVAAVVGDLGEAAPRLGREAMMTHGRVLESVLAEQTVLPMRFGVVMEDDTDVRDRLLGPYREHLAAQLERLAGRVELTLRATYEEEPLLREILAEEREIRLLHERTRHTPADAAYFDRIRLGEMITHAVEARRRRDTGEIIGALGPLADDAQLSEPRHERMVLSAAFLVDRQRIPEFDAAVDAVGMRQEGRMRLKYTGPLPPHSFVTLDTAS